ncbi:hypothetical protein AAEO56_13090 [Flavobacterium sp. DGU11]|uniref:Uncharacterized protein n=1 Tax=Flavobacterium arundinis TaxID=3139143 RepID=A0ABU9HYG2_9FLAO
MTNKPLSYIEVYFSCCFYEVFPDEGSSWETNLDGSEISAILDILEIPFDKNTIVQKYYSSNDTEVFHSEKDRNVFSYFDLEKSEDDQNDMFFLGFRLNIDDEPKVFPKIMEVFKQLNTCSALSYDRFNRALYNKVFNANFYFYNNNYSDSKRKMNHHNFVKQ